VCVSNHSRIDCSLTDEEEAVHVVVSSDSPAQFGASLGFFKECRRERSSAYLGSVCGFESRALDSSTPISSQHRLCRSS